MIRSKVNVSVNSKPDHPRATPRDSLILTAPGVGFSPTFFALGVSVLNSRNFLQFCKKNAGTSQFISKKPGAS